MPETVIPTGEAIRKAIRWISAQRDEEPESDPLRFVQEASLRFDLSPVEEDFLYRKFVLKEDASSPHDPSAAGDKQESSTESLAECLQRIAPYLSLQNRFFCYQGPDPEHEARCLEETGVEVRRENRLGADFLAIPRSEEALRLFSPLTGAPCDFCGARSPSEVHDYIVYDGQLFRGCAHCEAHERLDRGEVVATQRGRYQLKKQDGEYRIVH